MMTEARGDYLHGMRCADLSHLIGYGPNNIPKYHEYYTHVLMVVTVEIQVRNLVTAFISESDISMISTGP